MMQLHDFTEKEQTRQDILIIRYYALPRLDHSSLAAFIIKPDISSLSRNNTVSDGFIVFIMPGILGAMDKVTDMKELLLGRRIRALRNAKGWTQQELGSQADINYKFLGEVERGQQNPSFNTLVKVAAALGVELPELFRFEHEILDRKKIETRIKQLLKTMPDENLRQLLLMLQTLYPVQ
ncbi:helix-turn-helix domain-containing protein [Thermodesulfobacteriota bacterium]